MTQIIADSSRSAHATEPGASAAVQALPEPWDLPRAPSTPRAILEALDPLLESIVLRLGDSVDRNALLDQLAATLGFSGREAALPLSHIAEDDTLRRDLTSQARKIGEFIVRTAREVNDSRVSLRRYGAAALREFALRSHCDGHLWAPAVTEQLTGPAGGPAVMQLYNEWLHQIVLLRDSLIPFENWESLPVPLDRLATARGLRGLEDARGRFVGGLLTKRVQHAEILRMAQALFGLEPEDQSYGFSAGGVVVLPSSLRGNVESSQKSLLRWERRTIPGVDPATSACFRYAESDYLAQPRSEILTRSLPTPPAAGRIEGRRTPNGDTLLDIIVTIGGQEFRVDLGQALRSHRFSYRPAVERHVVRLDKRASEAVVEHGLLDLFSLPEIATAEADVHVLTLTTDPLVDLAILGKIYPENTVIQGAAPWDEVKRSGKNYGAKFVLQAPHAHAG